MDILKEIGLRIQRIRELKGITQEGLGERIELNPKYISSIERGQKNVTIKTLGKIANGLDVELFELLLTSEPANSPEATRRSIDVIIGELTPKQLAVCHSILRQLQTL